MEKQKVSGKAWAIVFFFTLFMVIMTFNLIVYAACAADTMKIYGIGQAGLTTLSSVTSVVGLFAGFIFGPMLDKLGSRKVLLVSILIGVILFYIRIFSTSFVMAVILTFFASFFVGVCQVAASKVLATWFPPESVSVAYAFQIAGAGIGSSVAFVIGNAIGLRGCLFLIAICYTALWIIWIVIGGEGPVQNVSAEVPEGTAKKVWSSKTLWLMSIAASCAVSATLLINTYVINAFTTKGMTLVETSLAGTVINLSLLAGGYLGTALMSAVKRYNVVTVICFAGGGAGYLLSWFTPYGVNTWIFLVIGGLIMGGSVGLTTGRTALIPLTGEFPAEAIGTAGGALEAIKGVISFVFPIAVSMVFATNYNAIYMMFGILCVIGLFTGAILVPELGPKGELQQEKNQKTEKTSFPGNKIPESIQE